MLKGHPPRPIAKTASTCSKLIDLRKCWTCALQSYHTHCTTAPCSPCARGVLASWVLRCFEPSRKSRMSEQAPLRFLSAKLFAECSHSLHTLMRYLHSTHADNSSADSRNNLKCLNPACVYVRYTHISTIQSGLAALGGRTDRVWLGGCVGVKFRSPSVDGIFARTHALAVFQGAVLPMARRREASSFKAHSDRRTVFGRSRPRRHERRTAEPSSEAEPGTSTRSRGSSYSRLGS